MLGISTNAKRLFTTPGMFSAYFNWAIASKLSGAEPAVACTLDTQISGWLNFSEYWSFHQGIPQAEKVLIERCLNSASHNRTIAIDIGANIGLFTVALAGIGYSEVHAFEPVKQTFTRLKANVANNQLLETVRLNCVAVGSEEGFAKFQIFENSPAINRLIRSIAHEQETFSTQRVSITTLDQYCFEQKISTIDFLKIDVEGMEPFVIKGAEELLINRRISTILLEICPANLEAVGNSIQGLYEPFTKVGYLPHLLLESGEFGEVLKVEDLQSMTLANVVVIPT